MKRWVRAAGLALALWLISGGMAEVAAFEACLSARELGITQAIFSSPIVDGEMRRKIRKCPGLDRGDNIRYLSFDTKTRGFLVGHTGNCIRWVRRVNLASLMDLSEHGTCPVKAP